MIDRRLLASNLAYFAIAGLFAWSFGHTAAAAMILIPTIVMTIVLVSIKKQTLKIRLRDLMENHEQANELQAALAEDVELRRCVSYLYHLGSRELIQVARIVTELRDSGNQSWLKELANQVRREDKK